MADALASLPLVHERIFECDHLPKSIKDLVAADCIGIPLVRTFFVRE